MKDVHTTQISNVYYLLFGSSVRNFEEQLTTKRITISDCWPRCCRQCFDWFANSELAHEHPRKYNHRV